MALFEVTRRQTFEWRVIIEAPDGNTAEEVADQEFTDMSTVGNPHWDEYETDDDFKVKFAEGEEADYTADEDDE